MKLLSILSLAVLSLLATQAHAAPPPLGKTINKYFGEHVPLFVLEKSINRQNIIIAYTKMDKNCRIVTDAKTRLPTFSIYWLDNGTRYDVASTAKDILNRMPVELNHTSTGRVDPTSFYIRLTDLNKVQHDLADDRILIKTDRQGAGCVANAYIAMHDGRHVRVLSTFTDMSFNFFRFDVDIHSLTVIGHEADSVRTKVERKYTPALQGRKRSNR